MSYRRVGYPGIIHSRGEREAHLSSWDKCWKPAGDVKFRPTEISRNILPGIPKECFRKDLGTPQENQVGTDSCRFSGSQLEVDIGL